MRHAPAALALLTAALVGCGSSPPPPARAPAPPEVAVAPSEPAVTSTPIDEPERSRPPSTASFEEAVSTPETVDMNDDRPHLTDLQLTMPVRGALMGCSVPSKAKVTIKAAVQYGRAIGVTVDVQLGRRRSGKRPSRARATTKIAECVDHNVRAVVWPPSTRRDSMTMEF